MFWISCKVQALHKLIVLNNSQFSMLIEWHLVIFRRTVEMVQWWAAWSCNTPWVPANCQFHWWNSKASRMNPFHLGQLFGDWIGKQSHPQQGKGVIMGCKQGGEFCRQCKPVITACGRWEPCKSTTEVGAAKLIIYLLAAYCSVSLPCIIPVGLPLHAINLLW